MIIFIISFLTTLFCCCYIYYNSVKDMYVNNDITEYLLSSVLEEDNDYDNDNY